MINKLVKGLKKLKCKMLICCQSKCSIGDNDEIIIENMNVENNINNNNNEVSSCEKIATDLKTEI
jgi:hypothetical protein